MDTLPKVVRDCFPGLPYEPNKSDWYWQLPNESEIWLGGLDDKERTEKILGKEYSTILLNECSQIQYAARNLAVTRLAQNCMYELGGVEKRLPLKMYYDQNPPSKSHWAYQLFYLARDPESKRPIADNENYVHLTMNPHDNMENLPAEYLDELSKLPARLRRRFLEGQYGDVAPGALWTEEGIEMSRVTDIELPEMQRIIIAIDPSGSDDDDNADNDEIGIIVGGLGTDGNGYVLEDLTYKAGPAKWGKTAVLAYDRHDADLIIGETNFGGEMVKFVIESAAALPERAGLRKPPFKKITASRGKVARAEPISALHEQGKIKFAGNFAALEGELCGFTTHGYVGDNSPNRGDAFVWLMSEIFPGIARQDTRAAKKRPMEVHAWSG